MPNVRRRRGGGGGSDSHNNEVKDNVLRNTDSSTPPSGASSPPPATSPSPSANVPTSSLPSWVWPVALTVVAAATRLWRIESPGSVVFDEYHFGKFVNWYNSGEYFFDIHPPLGKLTLFAAGKLFGYDHTLCQYDQIHQVYKPGCKFLVLRYTSAFFGILLPPVTYLIAREFGASSGGGLLAGALVIFDMLNLIESRLILMDSQLMFYCALSLYLALRIWKRCNATVVTHRRRTAPARMSATEENLLCFALGMACGAAVSIKWTALATPGMIAVESTFGLFFLKGMVPMRMLLKVAAVVIAQYTLWFAIHFALLPNSGSGDLFMPIEFQRTLINSTTYDPNAPAVPFWYIYPELNREMLDANARIEVVHSWASRYYQWVYNARGVLYWTGNSKRGSHAKVYLMGNPIALWLCLAGIIAFLLFAIVYVRQRRTRSLLVQRMEMQQPGSVANTIAVCTYCLCCYMLNLLPYMGVQRSAFCYHYMPGLYYAELLLAVFIDRVTRPYHVLGTAVVLVAVVLGFLYWSPWVYALPLANSDHNARRWLHTWS